ncbi:hypothetical protein L905_07225 [Agrobacterium sp. TS43]|nr:hypothetical protein L902_02070 [Agrobacterium radiobacter DSM 30147]KVK49940.1 hypothetical protein L903_18880 [Agrobacterium sp. JL28]KVK50232.1 hypothetical protein L904_18880 [Agrobacterium sp. LY4]KVK59274.1 hypothetical protein L905_07225 [Agrobacterium sp. TS43]KVK62988.1 hypothetical protein L906_18010 [Agrobacterium sp. TS45]KVK67512.1 hypothetical protein L907_17980 [Agrobacterium sp. C13]
MTAFLALTSTCAFSVPVSVSAQPQQINIIDVAGNLALTQKIFENYKAAHPDAISRFTFTKAPAPELAGKLQAMQNAGRLDVDIVLTGTDGLAAGMETGVWEDLTASTSTFGNPDDILSPGAIGLQKLAKMNGIVIAYSQQGPFIEYAPDRVKAAPTTAQDLLAWCKANPNKLVYARPANSGAGRTFLMGLPYILGDKDPKDPVAGWDKTWSYLKDLNSCIEYYPSGTTAAFKEFANGTRDLIVTTMGWDINPRALGIVPAEAEVKMLDNTTFVGDGQFFAVPKGLSDEKKKVVLDILKFALQKDQQAIIYDSGYLYPGPSVKDVTLDMAPAESREVIGKFGRPMYDELIAKTPTEVLLEPTAMVKAFRKWDEEIGAGKGQ